MPDIVVNVVHVANHANYTFCTPGALAWVPTSINWIACGTGHATCTHGVMTSDQGQLYASSSKAFGIKAIQTGDIRINKQHEHTHDVYWGDTKIAAISIGWVSCAAAHTKCKRNGESTYDVVKTSHLGAGVPTYNGQQTGDIVVNWTHTHSYYYHGSCVFEPVPATCPNMHPLCQVKTATVTLCTGFNAYSGDTGSALEA